MDIWRVADLIKEITGILENLIELEVMKSKETSNPVPNTVLRVPHFYCKYFTIYLVSEPPFILVGVKIIFQKEPAFFKKWWQRLPGFRKLQELKNGLQGLNMIEDYLWRITIIQLSSIHFCIAIIG